MQESIKAIYKWAQFGINKSLTWDMSRDLRLSLFNEYTQFFFSSIDNNHIEIHASEIES